MRRLLGSALVGMLALVAAACDEGIDEPSTRIFVAPPWEDGERNTYELEQGGREFGECVAQASVDGETTTLELLCGNDGNRDDRTVVVETETLVPQSSERILYNAEDDEESISSVDYHPPTATIRTVTDGEEHSRDRDLPEPSEDEPDPGYYDDSAILWLFRGIPLEEGFKSAYHNVNPGALVHITRVEVEVVEREEVEVPLGTFDTWRIRFRSSSITQYVWVEVAEPHRVIQAQLEDVRFKLAASE